MRQIFTWTGISILLLSISAFAVSAQSVPSSGHQSLNLHGPLGFIENKGQFVDEHKAVRQDLRYVFIRDGFKAQLMPGKISFELYTTKQDPGAVDEAMATPHYSELDPEDRPTPKFSYQISRVDVEFLGANPNAEMVAEESMPDYLNYYLAFTPVKGVTDVRQYNKVTYKNLYPNIDLVLIATPDQQNMQAMAYDFIVHPGGKVSDIQYRYHGNDGQSLYENGNLETITTQGKLMEMIPESYLQNNAGIKLMPVDVSFAVNKNVISFNAGHYDHNQSLVIDPILIWATYCGGDSSEEGRGLSTDSLGNVAIIGRSNSITNIATAGAFQSQLAGNVDIILEKYDSIGNRIWGTYYGGSENDHGRGLVADHLNNYYLGCHVNSPDGVATPGAYRENFAGGVGDDGLLAYFGSDGQRIFGTYYGGTDDETIRRLSIDHAGDVIMVGYTFSDSGIATPGAGQTVWAGDADLCLSKWTPDGQLIWGSYLGGTGEDHGRSVTIDKDDNIYINGSTGSEGIATPGVSRTERAAKQDFLLGKFTTDAQIIWVSYWGGAVEDRGRGVFVDSSSHYVYFMGYSASDTGVATPGAYQENWTPGYDNQGQPYHDIVLMKWTLDGQIVWSSYLGDPKDDRGRSITIIGDNEIYISGSTESPGTIATADGFQTVWGGKGDMFLEIWDSNGIRKYGTYFGGSGDEDNLALAVDDSHHNVYLIGTANSTNLATPGTAQTVFGGFDDAMLVKIQVHTLPGIPVASFQYTNVVCDTGEVTFTNTSVNADIFFWEFGDGSTSSQISPSYHYPAVGDYTVTLIATNSTTGNVDTMVSIITVEGTSPVAVITPQGNTTFCEGGSVVLASSTGPGYTYKWKLGTNFIAGANDSVYTVTENGNYKVKVTAPGGCYVLSDNIKVTVNPAPDVAITGDSVVNLCEGSVGLLTTSGDSILAYQWLNNGVVIPGATANALEVTTAGTYSVVATGYSDCTDTASVTVTVIPAPVIDASATASSVCLNQSTTLSASGGDTYEWQPGNFTGQMIDVTPLTSTTYSVTGTDTAGCQGTDVITIDVLPLPVVSLGNDTTVCDTANFVLDAGTGFSSYLWSTGAVTESISVSETNNYWVIVEDENSCSGSDSVNVTVTICTGIENTENEFNVTLYPNPTTGNFILSFTNPTGQKMSAVIENMLAQQVMEIATGTYDREFLRQINVSNLPASVYYVKIFAGHEVVTKKLVIER